MLQFDHSDLEGFKFLQTSSTLWNGNPLDYGQWKKMSTYNSSCLFESDEMSLSDSNRTLYVWAGRCLGEVLPQFN